jgi:glycosyltransferase involved in cell wall biosynthesis
LASLTGTLKKLVRPLIPAPLIRRFRPQAPSPADLNLDIVVADNNDRAAWLAATPDTVRVVSPDQFGSPSDVPVGRPGAFEPGSTGTVAVAARPLSADDKAELLAPLNDPEVGAVILGKAEARGFLSGAGPRVEPAAIAARRPVWDESGGLPPGDVNLAGWLARLLQGGHRLAIVPRPGPVNAPARVDPITAPGAVVVLAAVPLHDVGGGFRGAQIAMELCRRGYHVTYLAQYTSGHSVDLGLRFIHPRLEEYRVEDFDPAAYLRRLHTDVRIGLVEIPSPQVWAPARSLSRSGFRIIYDLIDDWSDEALGGWWYRAETEDDFIAAADTLTGSARLLVRNLEERSGGRPVAYVPNGVNQNMFAGPTGPAPVDIPSGDGPLLSYHGSLYGDWFDWDALAAVAAALPEARVQVIGDEHGHPPVPPNVHFLGLKPQFQLPSYLAQADASLVPFKLNETTHAVSPLKAYESLAMGVPVAAPPLEPLVGVEGTFLDEDLPTAVEAALAAPPLDAAAARAAHGWAERAGRLFDALGLPLPGPDGSDVVVKERPPRRYDRGARLL